VTRVAFDAYMAAAERKSRRGVVVEADPRPFLRPMAGLAFFAVPAAVNVLYLVAGYACCRDLLVFLPDMTSGAIHLAMCPDQRKFRSVVVKCLDPRPTLFIVAAIARASQAAFVRIDLLMTGDAIRRSASHWLSACVTTVARDRNMTPREGEIGPIVIKRLAIQLYDIGARPLMVGVTLLAG